MREPGRCHPRSRHPHCTPRRSHIAAPTAAASSDPESRRRRKDLLQRRHILAGVSRAPMRAFTRYTRPTRDEDSRAHSVYAGEQASHPKQTHRARSIIERTLARRLHDQRPSPTRIFTCGAGIGKCSRTCSAQADPPPRPRVGRTGTGHAPEHAAPPMQHGNDPARTPHGAHNRARAS